MSDTVVDTPQDGWFPEDDNAPITQMLFKNGHPIANIIKQGNDGWRSYSSVETNDQSSTGRPLSSAGSVATREEAKAQCETYATYHQPMTVPSVMFIDAANEQLQNKDYMNANQRNLDKQMKEIQEKFPNMSLAFYSGYMLAMQTARVFLSGNPIAIQGKLNF